MPKHDFSVFRIPEKRVNGKTYFTSKTLGLVDRQKEIRQLAYAFLTKEHMLLMGKPGTAKSQLAMNAFKSIDGASTFQIHLTKQTTEEYVFGPIDIAELRKGNIIHNTKDTILDANFAFIDEFFDASDVLLRSLLGVLNERVWMKGSQNIQSNLHTAILTSNYQRENEITEAILDRIIFKAEVMPVTRRSKRIKIYNNFLGSSTPKIPKIINLKELEQLSKVIEDPKSVTLPNKVLDLYDKLLEEYSKESKKYISQRTANKALKVLKAAALLDGSSKVDFRHLEEVKYVVCVLNKKIEEQIFDAVFEKHVGKIEEERVALIELDQVEKTTKSLPKNFDQYSDSEFIAKMREVNEIIDGLQKLVTPTNQIKNKRDNILTELRKIVANNKDKLFTRNNKSSSTSKQDVNSVEDAEVLEVEEGIPEDGYPF